jgi:hypothetical protein
MGDYTDYLAQFGFTDYPMALAWIKKKGKSTTVYGIVSHPCQRTIVINDNSFTVTAGELLNNGWQIDDRVMIPLGIYGIKGVL